MRQLLLLAMMVFCAGFVQAQDMPSIESLKTMLAEKKAAADAAQALADAATAEAADLQLQVDKLSGWRKGIGGVFGANFGSAFKWAGAGVDDITPGTSGSTKNSGITADLAGHLLKDTDKTFWHNNLKIVGSYKDLDPAGSQDDDNLFDTGNRFADIFNIASLAGYKITEKFALSGQGELNTTLLDGNFFDPALIDIGIGATWLPIDNMTVMVHPLNYNFLVRRTGDIDGTAALGAKVKVLYFNDFNIAGKPFHWDTNLTAFLPYSSVSDEDILKGNTGNQYWQWLNNITFEVWKGIGVGVGWGFRQSDFEAFEIENGLPNLKKTQVQSYTTLGLSYTL